MAFQARWRELKKTGWNSRKPTGLSDDFTYLKPGKTKKDVRGVDYFVGEDELMCYLDKLDLEGIAAEKATKRAVKEQADESPGESANAMVSKTSATELVKPGKPTSKSKFNPKAKASKGRKPKTSRIDGTFAWIIISPGHKNINFFETGPETSRWY